MSDTTTEPENARDRLSSALIRMRGICAVLTDLAEGDRDRALLYLVNRFGEDCEAAKSAYDELFHCEREAQS